MIVVSFVLGGLAAAAGTRLCVLGFVAAAVLGARDPHPFLAAVSTWTAAAAAGFVALERGSPRRFAVPALGAAAVVAAGASPNAAVVLGLWLLGTAAALVTRTPDTIGRRWALALCGSDLLLAAAIASTTGRGFEGWPGTLGLPAVLAIVVAAAIRVPLSAATSDDTAPSAVVIVRAQSALLIALAVLAGPRWVAQAVVAAGACAFAIATTMRRRAAVDGVQELALVAMTVATAWLGWIPSGWTWGALAAGTLMHHLRLMLGREPAGRFADAMDRTALLGLPFLPVVAALLEGAFRVRGWLSVVVLLGVAGGAAGRATIEPVSVRRGAERVDAVRAFAVLAPTLAASVFAPLLSLPRPPGGDAATWLGPAAGAVLVVIGLSGSQLRGVIGVGRPRSITFSWAPVQARTAFVDRLATDFAIRIGAASLAIVAIALWIIGLSRGFL
jgi:hypothetical protein